MDTAIALLLAKDGLINGSIYALIGVAMVMAFTLTRVIMVFLGDFIAFAALTFIALQRDGAAPPIIWLFLALSLATTGLVWHRERANMTSAGLRWLLLGGVIYPAVLAVAFWLLAPMAMGVWVDAALALLLVIPMAGLVYRLVFEPMAHASILVLLITAVGMHLVLMGLGLLMFGPEGMRGAPLFGGSVDLWIVRLTGQQISVAVASIAVLATLFVFFERSYGGLALRATAVNRLGAKLVGIRTARSGMIAFCIAGAIAGICGILIAPLTTMFYDTGFVIALKGFVVAVLAGLVSYPLAMIAALCLGLIEAFTSFHWSQYKDAITYGLILPALLVRSFTGHKEHEE